MRTSSNLPLRGFTTRTREPKGRLGCAAVRASESKRSPLAVFRPLKPGPYQLELPAEVPTARYSSTSSTVSLPPRPIIGVLTAFLVSQTSLKVMGLIAGPDKPPVGLPNRDFPVRKSMAIAG